ncbi:hypothetical protein EB796_017784 [Bugula neritina]|uniref:E3 ubiquitin-protein ligase RNF220 middle domain-containing protein n=1 Tax=Bugula neritina TaxID=10212 RepID=A0A7J7JCC3_BUGNE|nr:hypothetical protein EB796_017784 [Bugula neritina]
MAPFSPFFNYLPYKVFWNSAESGQLPALTHFPHYQAPLLLPPGHQLSPLHPPASFFSMLAQEDAASRKGAGCTLAANFMSSENQRTEERKPQFPSSPVTPPLTPLLPDNTASTSNSDATPAVIPTMMSTRVSSRNRRPPAFIEGESSCPICGALLRASELADHYAKELENLKNELRQPPQNRKRKESRFSERLHEKNSRVLDDSRKNVLARVRHNRKSRALKQVTSRSSASSSGGYGSTSSTTSHSATANTAVCPVCNKRMACSGEELTKHVETCLSRNSSDVSSNHDVSGSDGNTRRTRGVARLE